MKTFHKHSCKDTVRSLIDFHFLPRKSITPDSRWPGLRWTLSRGFCAIDCTRAQASFVCGRKSKVNLSGIDAGSGFLGLLPAALSTIVNTQIMYNVLYTLYMKRYVFRFCKFGGLGLGGPSLRSAQ